MSEEQDRAEIANELWSEAEGFDPVVVEESAEFTPDAQKQEQDPWDGVPKIIRDELEQLRAKVSEQDKIEYRLKQAESRVGGLTNELYAAKQAAKTVEDAPTKKQIEEAAGDDEAWESLKEDFPEWADATDKRFNKKISETKSEIESRLSQFSEKVESDSLTNIEKMERAAQRAEEAVISLSHKGWRSTVKSQDFIDWFVENKKTDSEDPEAIVDLLDEYSAYQKERVKPSDIKAERERKLSQAEGQRTGVRLKPVKNDSDMSEEELRQSIASEIWANG